MCGPDEVPISHQELSAFTYLGLQMKQLPNAIRVQQSLYVSDISPTIPVILVSMSVISFRKAEISLIN